MQFINSTFWDNFWPNFWSDVAVGIILSAIISKLYSVLNRVDLNVVGFEKVDDGDKTRSIVFLIDNVGKVGFNSNEIYWHLYFPTSKFLIKEDNTKSFKIRKIKIKGVEYQELTDILNKPVFPGVSTLIIDINSTISISNSNDVLFYLSTSKGVFPRNIKLKGNILTGNEKFGIVTVRKTKENSINI